MNRDDHLLLAETGPGTAMGNLLRHYWMPFILSSELATGGAPVRVKLMGEDLIAFRDTEGKVGLLGEHCAHRGAVLCAQRRLQTALLVSRLAIRSRRQLHRSAERAGADAVQAACE